MLEGIANTRRWTKPHTSYERCPYYVSFHENSDSRGIMSNCLSLQTYWRCFCKSKGDQTIFSYIDLLVRRYQTLVGAFVLFQATLFAAWALAPTVEFDISTENITHSSRNAYAASLTSFAAPFPFMLKRSEEGSLYNAPIRLREDGKPTWTLTRDGAEIPDDSGKYHRTGDTLYFSTTDRSDPRRNGRHYTVVSDTVLHWLTVDIALAIELLFIGCLAAGGFKILLTRHPILFAAIQTWTLVRAFSSGRCAIERTWDAIFAAIRSSINRYGPFLFLVVGISVAIVLINDWYRPKIVHSDGWIWIPLIQDFFGNLETSIAIHRPFFAFTAYLINLFLNNAWSAFLLQHDILFVLTGVFAFKLAHEFSLNANQEFFFALMPISSAQSILWLNHTLINVEGIFLMYFSFWMVINSANTPKNDLPEKRIGYTASLTAY